MTISNDISREPCPDRIIDDVGSAFTMGAVGGTACQFALGAYRSPRGHRFIGGSQTVRLNVPRIGGSFAVWGGLFSAFDCSMVYLRQKEDPWNAIAAGAGAGGFLSMRHGLRAASRSALFGGVLLALIEGSGLMLSRTMDGIQPQILGDDHPLQETAAPAPATAEKETKITGETLESFDPPPLPNFEFK